MVKRKLRQAQKNMDNGDNERHRQFIFKHWYGLQQDEAKEKKGGTSLSKRAKNYDKWTTNSLQSRESKLEYNHILASWFGPLTTSTQL